MDRKALEVPVATVLQLRLLNGRAKTAGYERSLEPGDLALYPGDLKCPVVAERWVRDRIRATFSIPSLAALARVGEELDRLESEDLSEFRLDISPEDRHRFQKMAVE